MQLFPGCSLSGSKAAELIDLGDTFPIFIIRIYHECEGRIEKSVPWITVWYHEACRVMTKVDREGPNFLFYPHTNIGFIFLSTTFFLLFIYLFIYFKIIFQKSLNTLRCKFT